MNKAYGHMQRAQELLSQQAPGFGNLVGLQLYKMDNTGQKTAPAGAPLVLTVPPQDECDQNRELMYEHDVEVGVVESGVQLTYRSTDNKQRFIHGDIPYTRAHNKFQFSDGLWLLRRNGEEITCASNESLLAIYDQVHAFVLQLFSIDDEGKKGNLFCPPLLLYEPKRDRHSDMDEDNGNVGSEGFQPFTTQDFYNWKRLKRVAIDYVSMGERKKFKETHRKFNLRCGLWEVPVGTSRVLCMSDQSLSEIFDHLNKKETTHVDTQTGARHTRWG